MADFTKLSDEELQKRFGPVKGKSKPKRNTPTGPGPVDTFLKNWGGHALKGIQMQHETEQKIRESLGETAKWAWNPNPDRVEQPSVRELQRNILTESRQGLAEVKRREGLPVQEQQLERRNRDLNTVKNPNINTPGVATEVVPTVKQADPTKPSKWKPKTRYSRGANKVQQLPEVKAAEVKALENTKKTSIENLGASALNSIWNQGAIGSTVNKVKNINNLIASISKVGAGATLKNVAAGINPLTLIASLVINKAKQDAQGGGVSSGTGYQSIDKGQEYDEWNWG